MILDRDKGIEHLVIGCAGTGTGTVVVADSGAVDWVGSWNVATNTPAVQSIRATLSDGDFYVVSTGGTLTGADIINSHNAYADIPTWSAGDWCVWNDTQDRFLRVDNASLLPKANSWTGLNKFQPDSSGNSQLRNMGAVVHAKDVVTKEHLESYVGAPTVYSTSAVIAFASPAVHAASWNASTGTPTGLTANITESLIGAIPNVTQTIYHNHTSAPTFPANWVKIGFAGYVVSTLNIIHCRFVKTGSSTSRIEYWITQ